MQTKTTTEKQERYIKDLCEEEFADINYSMAKYAGPEKFAAYAVWLAMEIPEDKAEASAMIDDLKIGGTMAYARRNREFGVRVMTALKDRFPPDARALKAAVLERYETLDDADKRRAQVSGKAYRELVLDPILSVEA